MTKAERSKSEDAIKYTLWFTIRKQQFTLTVRRILKMWKGYELSLTRTQKMIKTKAVEVFVKRNKPRELIIPRPIIEKHIELRHAIIILVLLAAVQLLAIWFLVTALVDAVRP